MDSIDVKLRSQQARAIRTRLAARLAGGLVGTIAGLFLLWQGGNWLLKCFIFESNAIIRYMGATAPSPAFPADPLARAKVDQWLEYFSNQAGRWTTAVWFNKVIGPKYFNDPVDEKKKTRDLLSC